MSEAREDCARCPADDCVVRKATTKMPRSVQDYIVECDRCGRRTTAAADVQMHGYTAALCRRCTEYALGTGEATYAEDHKEG